MLAGISIGTELSTFTRRRSHKIVLGLILVMPLILAGLYLWSLWNPSRTISQLPVAIVNEDTQAAHNPDDKNIVTTLTKNNKLTWNVVSNKQQAIEDLQKGKYAMLVTIPAGFSQTLTESTAEHKTNISIAYNDANSFTQSNIGKVVMNDVLNSVRTQYSMEAAKKVVLDLDDADQALAQASQEAARVQNNTMKLKNLLTGTSNDAQNLANGMLTARDSYDDIGKTVNQATLAGTGFVTALDFVSVLGAHLDPDFSALQPLATEISQALNKTIDPVALAGVTKIGTSASLSVIADGVRGLGTPEAENLAHQLDLARKNIDDMSLSPESQQLLREQTHKAITDMFNLQDPNGPVQQGLIRIRALSEETHQALRDIRDKLNTLNNSAFVVKQQLDNGTGLAFHTFADLKHFTAIVNNIDDKATTMATNLQAEVNKHPSLSNNERDNLIKNTADPLQVAGTTYNAASNTGTGLSPFFLAAAIFFGALLAWLTTRALHPRAIAAGLSGIRASLISAAPVIAIVAAQTVLLYIVLILGVHFRPRHALETLLFLLLTSAAFVSFIQAVIIVSGKVTGRIVALLLFIIQLVVCGGLIPTAMQNPFLDLLHPFLPMSYATSGLNQLVMGRLTDLRLWLAILVLLLVTAASLGVSSYMAVRKRILTEEDLTESPLMVL